MDEFYCAHLVMNIHTILCTHPLTILGTMIPPLIQTDANGDQISSRLAPSSLPRLVRRERTDPLHYGRAVPPLQVLPEGAAHISAALPSIVRDG